MQIWSCVDHFIRRPVTHSLNLHKSGFIDIARSDGCDHDYSNDDRQNHHPSQERWILMTLSHFIASFCCYLQENQKQIRWESRYDDIKLLRINLTLLHVNVVSFTSPPFAVAPFIFAFYWAFIFFILLAC